jgi:excinuclease ABC subunit A
VIDLGPEGGDAGGVLVAAGTPERVAATASSHTGAALAALMSEPAPRSNGHGGNGARTGAHPRPARRK